MFRELLDAMVADPRIAAFATAADHDPEPARQPASRKLNVSPILLHPGHRGRAALPRLTGAKLKRFFLNGVED